MHYIHLSRIVILICITFPNKVKMCLYSEIKITVMHTFCGIIQPIIMCHHINGPAENQIPEAKIRKHFQMS